MDINIIAPGKMDRDFFKIFEEYKKRCRLNINLMEFTIKENYKEKRIELESNYISTQLSKINNRFVILLDIDGKSLSSIELTNIVIDLRNQSIKNLIFVIGGAFGLSEDIKKLANLKISFGKNTWPHNLIKVMLMEQIFRIETIIDGRDYHH